MNTEAGTAASAMVADLRAMARSGTPLDEADVEIVDAHAHLGPYRDFFIPSPDARGILAVADRCGVRKVGIASHRAIGPDWIGGNRATAEAVAQHPDRLYGYAVASPHHPTRVRAELGTALATLGMRGIKLHPDLHADAVTGRGYRPAWEYAAEHGVPVLCHTFHRSPYCDPSMFGEIARRYPAVAIVLVHAGSKREAFPGAIALARDHPHLHLDVSGSYVTGRDIAAMVRGVGADRVLFSSDVPFIDLRFSLGRVVFAPLAPEERLQVLGRNARRLFRL